MKLCTYDETEGALTICAGGFAKVIRADEISGKFDALTHRPDRRARTELKDCATVLTAFGGHLAELAEQAEADDFDAAKEGERFARNYMEAAQDFWHAESRCLNWFVTGRGNFPKARNDKRMAASRKKADYLLTLPDRAVKAAKRRALPYGAATDPIRQGDPDAVAKIERRKSDLEEKADWMKAVNRLWRKHGKPKADNTAAWAKIAQAAGLPVEDFDQTRLDMARDPMDRAPFPAYALSNARQEIRRYESRLDAIAANRERAEKAPGHSAEIDGYTVEIRRNVDAGRLQLFFEGKPGAETRATLKAHGFRWAPSQGAWQRYLNATSEDALARLIPSLAAA